MLPTLKIIKPTRNDKCFKRKLKVNLTKKKNNYLNSSDSELWCLNNIQDESEDE